MKDNLPNVSEGIDPLDALLREADGYLPDNGFTARVITALPARQKQSWRRFMVLSTAMLIGAVLVLWQLPAAFSIYSTMPKHWSAFQWPALFALVPLLAALVSFGWVVFAVANEEE
jgi:uncharacterized membrane protein YcjF (UPF0283 family)